MKAYFNTNAFDELIKKERLDLTKDPEEADLLVLGAKPVDYKAFTRLRAVYRFGVGSENIDFEYLKEKAIPVHFPSDRAKEALYDGTANFTVYAILNMLYKGAFGDRDTWKKNTRDEIRDKTALVIGTGNIGSRVGDKLRAFMRVETYDISANKASELEPLIRRADIITIHIPLNSETAGFFDGRRLGLVKDGAILVNTARGELFDEEALYGKLLDSSCRAFFDVFWKEPYEGKLKALGQDKFFMTPHSASNSKEFAREGFSDILNIMKRLEKR